MEGGRGSGRVRWRGETEEGKKGNFSTVHIHYTLYSTYTLYTIPFCNVELLLYNFDFPNQVWPFCRAEMFETMGNFCC